MKLSCTLLCTISCVSFSLCAMEEDQLSLSKSAQVKSNQDYYYRVNTLYNTTYQALRNYNPTNPKTVSNIFQIIDKTTDLHKDGCEEKEFGKFAYNQHRHQQSDQMPLYISLFFEKIAQYKAHMKKNNFIPTTLEEFNTYKKIPLALAAVDKAASYRLILNVNTVHPNNTKFLDPSTNKTDGIIEYENFMEDIKAMLLITPEEAKITADLLYNPKL